MKENNSIIYLNEKNGCMMLFKLEVLKLSPNEFTYVYLFLEKRS